MVSPMLANPSPTCLIITLQIQLQPRPYFHAPPSYSSPDLGSSRPLKPYPDCDIPRVHRPPAEASRAVPKPCSMSGFSKLLSFSWAKKKFSKNRELKIHPIDTPLPSSSDPVSSAPVTVISAAKQGFPRVLRAERSDLSLRFSPRQSKLPHPSPSIIHQPSPPLGIMNGVKHREPHRTQEHTTTLRPQRSLGTLMQHHEESHLLAKSLAPPFPPMSRKHSLLSHFESSKLVCGSASAHDLPPPLSLPSQISNISVFSQDLDMSPASIECHSRAPNSTSPSRTVMLRDSLDSIPNAVPAVEQKLQSTACLDCAHQISSIDPRARLNSFGRPSPSRSRGYSLQTQPGCGLVYPEHTFSQRLPSSNTMIGLNLEFSPTRKSSSSDGFSVLTPRGIPAPTESDQSGLGLRTRRPGRLSCHTLRSSLTEEEYAAAGDVDDDEQCFERRPRTSAPVPRGLPLLAQVKKSGADLQVPGHAVLLSNVSRSPEEEDSEAGDLKDCKYSFRRRPTLSLNQSERAPAPVFPLFAPTCHAHLSVVDTRNRGTRRRGLPSIDFESDPLSIGKLFADFETHLPLEPQYTDKRATSFLQADRISKMPDTPPTPRPFLLDEFPSVPVRPSLIPGPSVATPNLLVLPATPDFGALQAKVESFPSSKTVTQPAKPGEEYDTEYAISNEISLSGISGADLSFSQSTSFISNGSSSNMSQEGENRIDEDERRAEELYQALNLRSYKGSSDFEDLREADYGIQDDRISESHGTSMKWEAIGYDMGYRKSPSKEDSNEPWRMATGGVVEEKSIGIAL